MPDPSKHTKLVVAYEADPTTIMLVQQHIQSNGIRSQIVGDAVYNNTYIATEPKPQIWVRKTDLETARLLIEEFVTKQDGPRTSKSVWNCPTCDESNPSDFDYCWNCQETQSE